PSSVTDSDPSELYTLSLHDARPISTTAGHHASVMPGRERAGRAHSGQSASGSPGCGSAGAGGPGTGAGRGGSAGNGCCGCAAGTDRKSTRLNSSHVKNSYAVLCLKI